MLELLSAQKDRQICIYRRGADTVSVEIQHLPNFWFGASDLAQLSFTEANWRTKNVNVISIQGSFISRTLSEVGGDLHISEISVFFLQDREQN